MKTLTVEATQNQLNACGVMVNNLSSDLGKVLSAQVSAEHSQSFNEAKINAIRHNLAAKDEDFNPKDIVLSSAPLPRAVIVYNDTPFIVDSSDKKGIFLISMDGEEYELVPVINYPVIGTITI